MGTNLNSTGVVQNMFSQLCIQNEEAKKLYSTCNKIEQWHTPEVIKKIATFLVTFFSETEVNSPETLPSSSKEALLVSLNALKDALHLTPGEQLIKFNYLQNNFIIISRTQDSFTLTLNINDRQDSLNIPDSLIGDHNNLLRDISDMSLCLTEGQSHVCDNFYQRKFPPIQCLREEFEQIKSAASKLPEEKDSLSRLSRALNYTFIFMDKFGAIDQSEDGVTIGNLKKELDFFRGVHNLYVSDNPVTYNKILPLDDRFSQPNLPEDYNVENKPERIKPTWEDESQFLEDLKVISSENRKVRTEIEMDSNPSRPEGNKDEMSQTSSFARNISFDQNAMENKRNAYGVNFGIEMDTFY